MSVTSERAILPGPFAPPGVGHRWQGLQMLSDQIGFFVRMQRRYGEICSWAKNDQKFINIYGPRYNRLLLSDPETFVIDAFREHHLPVGSSFERLTLSLMRLNGNAHQRHRKMIQPAFRTYQLERYRQIIVDETDRFLAGWQPGESRQLDEDFLKLVTLISMRTMFGMEAETDGERLVALIKQLIRQFSSPLILLLPFNVPGLPFRAILDTTDKIERFVMDAIERKRADLDRYDDVLAEMMKARDETGSGFTNEELVAHAYTILCQEAAASALLWTFFLLDCHPDVYRRVAAEIDEKLHGAPPGMNDLKELTYLDRVLKEALRLFPSSPFGLRYAVRDCTLGDHDLKKGTGIFFSSYVTHRMPEIFENPLAFDPDRWTSAACSPFEYLPFGAGAHHCIGQGLALVELKVILAMILQRFMVRLQPKTRIDLTVKISLVPKQGLAAVLRRREAGHDGTVPEISGNVLSAVIVSGSTAIEGS
ncbi:cytochrome P450 (plasmid) [Azospirillum sp. B510]|uniref:cytochrome P450 n=1 Tax=Azospirillum sp. (strain B510) TaxID=137722 RepID=UPI0001C4CF5C|nr:cytochrome P450 [Azospirillum sp. B510]BAI76830.1 cytochrome P450 [Azospirillum sp. B510]